MDPDFEKYWANHYHNFTDNWVATDEQYKIVKMTAYCCWEQARKVEYERIKSGKSI